MTDDWDASAISAVAALIVALFALLVATAQALQQYLITGQLIRLCDSVVFGPLPGQGYRVWQFSQFRFRVLYSIPQINLDADLWPKESPHVKSYAIRCPSDLVTAPMQVSMRDIAVMGLTAGMKITDCSFTEKSLMQEKQNDDADEKSERSNATDETDLEATLFLSIGWTCIGSAKWTSIKASGLHHGDPMYRQIHH
ncbi:hypothetical protein FPCIR_11110 [Fusarium pseudocircinatum]|uniref:Uncharacterized protein n=1 Tax=Fusarium pseudocircinatum TaxID=56676 RepID=A0A8H5KUC1_9HYPO|nr:hypothetical protein FPCIR_11110 [Fusarium pseudocircinatum]